MSDAPTAAELRAATAAGLRWVTLARLGTEVFLLGSMVVLAHLIPPSAFGMFAVAVIVQELAITVPSEGVGSAIVQRRSIEREHLQGGLALTLLVGATLTILLLVLSDLVVRPIYGSSTATLVALTTPWFLLGAVLALPMAVLRRRLDFRLLSLLGLSQTIVRSAAAIVLAAGFGLDASALVWGGLAGTVVMVTLALIVAPVPLPRWRRAAIRDLLPYGGPASLACFAWAGFRNGDYAVVGARLGPAQAGFYWRGFQLAVDYQGKISQIMTQIAFPVLARSTDPDEMFALRRRMVRLLTIVVFPGLVCLVLLAPVVVPAVFGPNWEPAVLPTQILAGAGAATVVIDAVGSVLMATGRTRALLGYGVAHFAIYVGAVLAVSRHGLAAVSIAAVSVHFVFLLVAYQVLLRGRLTATLRLLWGDVSAAVVSCVGLFVVAWPVDAVLADVGAATPVRVLLVGGSGVAAYFLVMRARFPDAWGDVRMVLRRVLPVAGVRAAVRRVPLLAGRAS